MAKWTVEKVHHWHICRNGKRFATVDNEVDANEILKFCKYDDRSSNSESLKNVE